MADKRLGVFSDVHPQPDKEGVGAKWNGGCCAVVAHRCLPVSLGTERVVSQVERRGKGQVDWLMCKVEIG